MFTPTELHNIAKKCPSELNDLLNELGLSLPEMTDDLDVYKHLDEEITKKMCRLLKCEQIVEGYCHLLDLANVPYRYSETAKELTAKIVDNAAKIRLAATSPRTT